MRPRVGRAPVAVGAYPQTAPDLTDTSWHKTRLYRREEALPTMYYSGPGIFNALDDWGGLGSGMTSGDPSIPTARHNAAALQATINAAVAACSDSYEYGAIVLIPSNCDVPPPVNAAGTVGSGGDYYIAAPVESDAAAVTITCPYPILILGTSGATRLLMINDNIHMFVVNNGQSASALGGITFQDLQFKYDSSLNSGAAIYSEDSQNVRLFRCAFTDVPQGVLITNTLRFSMIDCTGVYIESDTGTILTVTDSSGPGTGSLQAYIADCSFHVAEGAGEFGTSGLVVGVADGLRCVNTHFDGFANGGVQIKPDGATSDLSFLNVVAQGPGTQLLLQPSSGGKVKNAAFVNSHFTNNSSTSTESAVVADGGGENANVDTVRFVSCTCQQNPSAGLEIRSAQNVEILGGSYSSNGQAELSVSTGIWMNNSTGSAPSNVRIVGASCAASALNQPPQTYGITVSDGSSDVFIEDCDLTGYTGTPPIPINFASPGTNVQVVDCPGYNDQAVTFASAPANGSEFDGVTYGYYGPVAFYIGANTTVTEVAINGDNTHLLSGIFALSAGSVPYAVLSYSAIFPFLLVGQ